MILAETAKAIEKTSALRLILILPALHLNKSSYYRFLDLPPEDKDQGTYEIINKLFEKRKKKAGIRQLKMMIERDYGIIMNHKKIARIKKKYGLITKIRRKNKYKLFAKKNHEHRSVKNKLDRKFKVTKPDQVYSTDITQLNYGRSQKAYLAAFKDLCTKEIISHEVSSGMSIKLTDAATKVALKKNKSKKLMVHSDQGLHFTHISFRKKLEAAGAVQSMSRKGNCLDNAPIESFFGLIKDHLDLKQCTNIDEVKKMVTKEIEYYNNERPQLGLKKMPPREYRRHLVKAGLF